MGSPAAAGPRLTPRVSQLRQEECADISNSREVNHERDLHSALQISQSWEDLTIVTENWSCRDDLNPVLNSNCSSPSPTSRHHQSAGGGGAAAAAGLGSAPTSTTTTSGGLCGGSYSSIRYPFGMSPSPTRKTFATRRSMSPNHVRPSQLCPVKRKFDIDDTSSGANGSASSPPPHKKMFLDIGGGRGASSPSHHPLQIVPICPSPDSGTYEGRTTPRSFISKLCSSNSLSSFSSASASPTSQLEMNALAASDPASQLAAAMASSSSSGSEKGNLSGNSNSSHNNNNNTEAKEDAEEPANGKVVVEEEGEATTTTAAMDCDHCDKGGGVHAVRDDSPMKLIASVGKKEDDIVDDGIGDEVVTEPGEQKQQGSANGEELAVGI